MSSSLDYSWFGNIFCCQNQNGNSTEKTSDHEEETEPFTRQENGEISPEFKNGRHQNEVITEQPRANTKAENKILFCCTGVCSIYNFLSSM